jgi:hypothetical protein
VYQCDPLDAEHLGEQALLHPHIIGHRGRSRQWQGRTISGLAVSL